MRGMLRNGQAEEAIQAAVDSWRPGIKARGKSQAEKARDMLAKLSPEEREELLGELDL